MRSQSGSNPEDLRVIWMERCHAVAGNPDALPTNQLPESCQDGEAIDKLMRPTALELMLVSEDFHFSLDGIS